MIHNLDDTVLDMPPPTQRVTPIIAVVSGNGLKGEIIYSLNPILKSTNWNTNATTIKI